MLSLLCGGAEMSASQGRVKVVVRVRPLLYSERSQDEIEAVEIVNVS